MKIAIVAADAMSEVLLQEQVEGLGHAFCGWATRLDKALELIARSNPDLIILDPYFDSVLADTDWLDEFRRAGDFELILLGVDAERDAKLVRDLRPVGIVDSPPGEGDLERLLREVVRRDELPGAG